MNKIIIVSMLLVALGGAVGADEYDDMRRSPLSPEEVANCLNTYIEEISKIKYPRPLREAHDWIYSLDTTGTKDIATILSDDNIKVDFLKFAKNKSKLESLVKVAQVFYALFLQPAELSEACFMDGGVDIELNKAREDIKNGPMINKFEDYLELCHELLGHNL